jgi:hypothetical protein
MREIAKRQRAFEKELLKALGPVIKGTPWKKSSTALYMQSGSFFQDFMISVQFNDEKVSVVQRFKPMALDFLLWDIMGMTENASEPLSFRTWGAFTCGGLPIYEELVEQADDALDMATNLVSIAENNASLFQEFLQAGSYSALLAKHPNQVERGAYAVTLVTSLINDGDYEAAACLASEYEAGRRHSVHQLSSFGVSFHRLALNWLDAGKTLKRFAIASQ